MHSNVKAAFALISLLVALPVQAKEPAVHSAIAADPAVNAQYPASMSAFVLPSHDGAMNAVMYQASGPGLHPTLLLLHGFPGNEQNLDLAQAARRDGWNVLTLHYRGSWGSPGSFSFTHAAEDAHTALAFLRDTANVAKYRIDTANIVVAGHSMGGFMAADAAADDAKVAGLFLIDPWDIGATAAAIQTPDGLKWWKEEAQSDLPPLAGTSYDALTSEITGNAERFDLRSRVIAFGNRPMAVVGAERGIGEPVRAVAAAAQSVAPSTVVAIMPTDHSFSDKRIALADMLLRFLDRVAPPIH